MFCFHQCIDKINILEKWKHKEVWDIFKNGHADNDKLKKVQLLTLRRQFELLLAKFNEKILEYFNRITRTINQAKIYCEVVFDQIIVNNMMSIVSSKFDISVVEIEELKDLLVIKIEELQCLLETRK